jgi:hypothetical protein
MDRVLSGDFHFPGGTCRLSKVKFRERQLLAHEESRPMHGFVLGDGYRWTDEFSCTFQLVARSEKCWYITDASLENFHTISPTITAGSNAVWSLDGQRLYITDHRHELKRIRFANTRSKARRTERVTPRAWDGRLHAIVQGCFAPDRPEWYCLVDFQEEDDWSIWRVSESAKNDAELILQIPGVSGHLFFSTAGPLLVRRDHPRRGMFSVTNIETWLSVAYDVSGESMGIFFLSPSGACGIVSTCLQSPEGKLYSFDMRTGQMRFLLHANCGAVSPDGRFIAAIRADQELMLFDCHTNSAQLILSVDPREPEASLPSLGPLVPQWSPDGRWLVFALFRWREASSCGVEASRWKQLGSTNKLELLDCVSLGLDTERRSIIRLPMFCQAWTWRPIPLSEK